MHIWKEDSLIKSKSGLDLISMGLDGNIVLKVSNCQEITADWGIIEGEAKHLESWDKGEPC